MASLDSGAGDDEMEQGLPEDTDYAAGLEERLKPRKKTPPLLVSLADRRPTRLHWMGVSYGLNSSLFRFWNKCVLAASCLERACRSDAVLRALTGAVTGLCTCVKRPTTSRASTRPSCSAR